MKTISLFLALVNSLMAGVIILFSFSASEIGQSPAWWLFTRIAAAAAVIVVGVLTWIGNRRTFNQSLTSLCSLFLVALGAATAVWTVHLALVSGDMEYYMVAFGASLMAQGTASLLTNQPGNIST